MKRITLSLVATMSLVGNLAWADFRCVELNGELSMDVDENHVTHLGDTSVLLKSGTEEKFLFGNMHFEDGGLLRKKVVEFYPFSGDQLTIVFTPKACGRGSCDYDSDHRITARLEAGENQAYFSCHEVSP